MKSACETRLLRYPGGKQRLHAFIATHAASLTPKARYIEPFLGGGSVFLSIGRSPAVLADLNGGLIRLYQGIRRSPKKVWELYAQFPRTKAGYYQIRDAKPQQLSVEEHAARLLYLNRTCFKGMWRHNKEGKFNVGYGGQSRRSAISESELIEVGRRLRGVQLQEADFEKIIDDARPGEFIFSDPPYRPGAVASNRDLYAFGTFSYNDQVRLAQALLRASRRGVLVMLTNSSHPDIVRLYPCFRRIAFPFGTSERPGIRSDGRGEMLLLNYDVVPEALAA